MADFEKYTYEEVYRYYEFARTDGKDGLASGETISTATVTIADDAGVDASAAMISNVTPTSTMVSYKLKAGTAGEDYVLTVKAVTSNGQKLEGVVSIEVK